MKKKYLLFFFILILSNLAVKTEDTGLMTDIQNVPIIRTTHIEGIIICQIVKPAACAATTSLLFTIFVKAMMVPKRTANGSIL